MIICNSKVYPLVSLEECKNTKIKMSVVLVFISIHDILNSMLLVLSLISQPGSSACQFMSTGSILGPVYRVNPHYLLSISPAINPFVKHVTAIHWNFKDIVGIFSSTHVMQSTGYSENSIFLDFASFLQFAINFFLVAINGFSIFRRTL